MEQESNISRDHIALEAMKVIMKESTHEITNPWARVRRWLGLPYKSWLGGLTPGQLAAKAYDVADAMVAERQRRRGTNGKTE